jgi:hypothetical protein
MIEAFGMPPKVMLHQTTFNHGTTVSHHSKWGG